MPALHCARVCSLVASVVLLAACSNGRGSLDSGTPPPAPGGFTLGGTVSGLVGTGLVLRNNDGADLTISGNGGFTFTGALADGASYHVTIVSQPSSPVQTCSIANGTGTIAGANVTTVTVTFPFSLQMIPSSP